jgi:hypothetical protein
MPDLSEAWQTVASVDNWESVAAATGGFLAPSVVRNIVEPRSPWDVPDELYGVAVMAGASYAPMYGREMAVGGGLYTADKALERIGLKQTVTNLGGN